MREEEIVTYLNWKNIDRWLSYFGLVTYLLFLLSIFFGEYLAYTMIVFVFVGGTPLALLWAVGRFRLQGIKMPHRSQGKVNLHAEDVKQIIEAYQKRLEEKQAEEKLNANV